MDIALATPAEIDTELARLHDINSKHHAARSSSISTAHRFNGERAVYKGRQRVWLNSAETTLNELALKIADECLPKWDMKDAIACIEHVGQLDRQIAAVTAEIEKLEAEYARRPWSRFIAVKDGHLHSGTRCVGGSIGISTTIGWHPELSGKTEADAVELLGERLCSHCFPSAPVAWTVGAKPKTARCEGSGMPPVHGSVKRVRMSVSGRCTGCQVVKPLTQHGHIRAHQPKD